MSSKKAYVVGSNVKNSLSPTIFNYWFKKYNIDGFYNYKEIKESSFKEEINLVFQEKKLCGFNITTPFKEKIISYLSQIDVHSKKIGAVNCVTKKTTLQIDFVFI